MLDRIIQSRPVKSNTRRSDPAGHVPVSIPERRRFSRGVIASEIRLHMDEEYYTAELIDISAGGAQLRSPVVPRVGAKITVEVERLGAVAARVVRRLSNSIAIEFELPETMCEEFVRRLEGLQAVAA